jgi:predicted RNase H-like nuclease (RuvC/YqgF family)
VRIVAQVEVPGQAIVAAMSRIVEYWDGNGPLETEEAVKKAPELMEAQEEKMSSSAPSMERKAQTEDDLDAAVEAASKAIVELSSKIDAAFDEAVREALGQPPRNPLR